jgi:hypothetical protein
MELQSESAIMQQSKMHLATRPAKVSSASHRLQDQRVNVDGSSFAKAKVRLSIPSPKAKNRDVRL